MSELIRPRDPESADSRPPVVSFHLDHASGVPTYRQLVAQVEQALRLGYIATGDQLPTVKDVVRALAINPNTVQKAYRELELKGLCAGKPGAGTFIVRTLSRGSIHEHAALQTQLTRWLDEAHVAGLDQMEIEALFASTARRFFSESSPTDGAHAPDAGPVRR